LLVVHLLEILGRDAVMHAANRSSRRPTRQQLRESNGKHDTCLMLFSTVDFRLGQDVAITIGPGILLSLQCLINCWEELTSNTYICTHIGTCCLNNSTPVQLIVCKNTVDLTDSER
jgi:hypothetical protein